MRSKKVFFYNQKIEILDQLKNGMLSLLVALVCVMNSEAYFILWKKNCFSHTVFVNLGILEALEYIHLIFNLIWI